MALSGDAAWNRLADGVTAYLLTTDIELGDGDALIVESREKDTAVGGVGAYVQFRPEDGGAMRAEIIGDEFLPAVADRGPIANALGIVRIGGVPSS